MPAYLIAHIDVTDLDAYLDYARQTPRVAEAFGGRYLVKAGHAEQLEGQGRPRNVVIEFPDFESAKRYYESTDYREIMPIALKNSIRDIVIVEGYDPAPNGA
ncbi:DUF1330 domain-containing protein [Oceanomicrobium pacificus]|uniref:DUF1330 domain-containing protein n=1 Tax=Oceanomicrobium pacificus TaxID=2692916 RepID=A0A6B0TQP9_9RHOB|nr:DUF1330 domain-containing protein [Oceanomicrobium pacificus]MXU66276.1 DUF1330 domain-containing protein [Oceanomicrobium pacificus]